MLPVWLRDRQRISANAGSPIKTVYKPVFDKQGVMELEEAGEENFYDYIQSFRDSVDIHVILKRFANGEIDVLNRVQGAYGDFTQMPKTYAELLNRVNEGRQFFESLPVETREKFNHSFEQFMASMDSPDFLEKAGLVQAAKAAETVAGADATGTVITPEVTASES